MGTGDEVEGDVPAWLPYGGTDTLARDELAESRDMGAFRTWNHTAVKRGVH